MQLDNATIKRLRGIGHDLKPIVMIGNKGITPTITEEIDRALSDHELIKVKLPAGTKEERDIIGADRLIFQDLDDLIDAVKDTKYSKVEGFDCAVFNGCYITGQINEAYLEHLQEQRNDTAKTGKKGVQIVADTPVDMMGVEEL